jgi:GNAT superfamily N-acetyltransferase
VKAHLVRPDYFASPDDLVHAVREALRSGAIPVVPLGLGAHASRRSRFELAHYLVVGLRSRKLIHLRRRGGLQLRGKPLPLVNLSKDTAALLKRADPVQRVAPPQRAVATQRTIPTQRPGPIPHTAPTQHAAQTPRTPATQGLSRSQRLLLRAARHLVLHQAQHACTVALASPLDLLRELFTVKGSGTLMRAGAQVGCLHSYAALSRPRLQGLLESAFSQRLDPQFFSQPASRIYLDSAYRGAAVVMETPLGTYLSKFAVDREAQGEGIGSDLWEAVVQAHPTLFWRSRRDNPINAWYVRQCDGLQRSGRWTVFWRGFAPHILADAIAFAQAAPADFC